MNPVITARIQGNFFRNDKITFGLLDRLDRPFTVSVESRENLRWYHKIQEVFFGQKWAAINAFENGAQQRIFIHIKQLSTQLPQYEITTWAKTGELAQKILKLATPRPNVAANIQNEVTQVEQPQDSKKENSVPEVQVELQPEPPALPKNTDNDMSLREYVDAHRKEWEDALNNNSRLKIIKHITSLPKSNPTFKHSRKKGVPQNQSLYIIRDNKNPGKIRIFANAGELGRGHFKKVFKLKDIESGKLKVISKTSLSNKEFLQRNLGLTEAEAMQLFPKEKTILQSTSTQEINKKEYMIMKFCDLDDLQKYMITHRLTLDEQTQIIKDILKAVLKMHQKGFVHQDIKLPNIFLYRNKQGQVRAKLADLGFVASANNTSKS